jgi:hypothetical protein
MFSTYIVTLVPFPGDKFTATAECKVKACSVREAERKAREGSDGAHTWATQAVRRLPNRDSNGCAY